MVAGALAALGLDFGPTIAGSEANPRGFFENEYVRSRVKYYIARAGGHPAGQHDFPDPGVIDPNALRGSIIDALSGCNAYKEAKICLLWDSWTRAFPDSRYVFVRRDIDDIATSCVHTTFMRKRRGYDGWRRWAQYYVDAMDRMKRRVDHIEIWPDGSTEVFRPVAEFAGLPFNQEQVDVFVEPNLWNRHKTASA